MNPRQPAHTRPDILHLDNHVMVVSKPPGMPTQSDSSGDPDLQGLCKDYLKKTFDKPGRVYLGLVHRLDRPASGVMILARTSKAAARLSEQFRLHLPVKQYLAIVEGICRGRGRCLDYLIKENQRVQVVAAETAKARYAELAWRALAVKKGRTLLEIDLKTGRPHQIRVQLAHRGFPILGDLRYGARAEFDGRNLALHCRLLQLVHPVRQETMVWSAALPGTWRGHFQAPRLPSDPPATTTTSSA